MAIIRNVELFWIKCAEDRPERYQNQKTAPAKWSVQIRVKDKKTKDQYSKDYGMKFTPVEDDTGGLIYKTSLSRYAFGATDGVEDPNKPNKPVNVILADGTPLDPSTVGNGSVANVSFFVKDDKSSRTLKGIQVTKLKKFEPRVDEDAFELTDDFEIIEDNETDEDDVF